MNIHIDEQTYIKLKKATLVSIKMGSHLYGLNNANSDTDYLHIISTPNNWNHSLVWTHHNLQYKENNTDHVFTTLQNYIRNILKGDQTINYECLYSEEIKKIDFIGKYTLDFRNYSLIRSYLGLARRDLKKFTQVKDSKKLFHGFRGLYAAEQIYNNKYSNNIESNNKEVFDTLFKIKNNQLNDKEMDFLCRDTFDRVEKMRKNLSQEFQEGKINRLMNAYKLEQLDKDLMDFCSETLYQSCIVDEIIIKDIYSILDTEVTYEDK